MSKLLITGGAGFIGSNFIHNLIETNPNVEVTNIDALTYAGNTENLADLSSNSRYEFIHMDICDEAVIQNLFDSRRFSAVIHFAAESHVDRSINNPMAFIQTNVVGTGLLLRASLAAWQRMENSQQAGFRFLHISTDEVFGSLRVDEAPFSETTPYAPNSPYAASKAAGDHLSRAFFHTYGLPVIITNCSNNYGPYQFPEKMIPLMILNAINGKLLPIYGDGSQIRDWLFVKDHCDALLRILELGQPGQTYNIGGNNQPTNLEVVRQICFLLDEALPNSPFSPHEKLIQFVKDRPGHDRRYAMNITKIQNELNWSPKISLDQGLRETVHWYLDHQEWVNGVLKKSGYQDWLQTNYSEREKANK